jgi:hypothetical protein
MTPLQQAEVGLIQQFYVGAPFLMIATDIAGPSENERENQYSLIAMDCFTKWPEDYAIPNRRPSTATDVLMTNSCCFGAPRQLDNDQGQNFEYRLLQGVFQRLGTSKTGTTLLHPQSHGMVERCVNTVEENLRTVVSMHQKSYRASTHETAGMTPAAIVFGRELRLLCDRLFGVPPVRSSLRPITWWTSWIGCMISVRIHANI